MRLHLTRWHMRMHWGPRYHYLGCIRASTMHLRQFGDTKLPGLSGCGHLQAFAVHACRARLMGMDVDARCSCVTCSLVEAAQLITQLPVVRYSDFCWRAQADQRDPGAAASCDSSAPDAARLHDLPWSLPCQSVNPLVVVRSILTQPLIPLRINTTGRVPGHAAVPADWRRNWWVLPDTV